MDVLWLIIVALGPLVLGVLIAYALLQRRRFGAAEQTQQDKATQEVYRDEPPPGEPKRGLR
jgi:cytochrome c-type biogenesis protein CcmH/NrfF